MSKSNSLVFLHGRRSTARVSIRRFKDPPLFRLGTQSWKVRSVFSRVCYLPLLELPWCLSCLFYFRWLSGLPGDNAKRLVQLVDFFNILTALPLKTSPASCVDQVNSPFPWLICTSSHRNTWGLIVSAEMNSTEGGSGTYPHVKQFPQSPKNSRSNSR